MDPPPPPKVSPWKLPWKVPVATPNPTPDTVSRPSTIGLGTAQAFAAFPELSTTKLTKAQLKAAKQQTPSLPTLSTPDAIPPTLENIPEVPPSRRTPHRSPVRKSPERYRRASPVKRSPERVPRRAYSEVIASPRKQKKVPYIIQKRGESSGTGHVKENIEVSSSLVSVPVLPPPTQEKAELVDEQHNAPLSLESRTEFPDLSNKKGSTRKKSKMSYVTSSNVERNSKSTDEQNTTSQSPNTAPQGHERSDSDSITPTGSADNHEIATQLNNGDISHTPTSDLPTCNDEISTQSKMEVSSSATQFTRRDVDTSYNKIGAPQTQSKVTAPTVDEQIKKSETEKIEAKDFKSAIVTQSVVETKVTPAQDEINTLIASLTTSSGFEYKMNSAAEEKINPPPAPDGFQFIPLTDDSTYGVLIKTELNSFQTLLDFSSGSNSHVNTHMPENRQETLAQPDDPPRRYRALTFSSPEAAAYHREVNQPYLKSPEQQCDYDLAVQEGREKVRHQSGFQHETHPSCGKMVTRRGSVSYVVDVPSLQDAVAEDPTLILNRISGMKDEIHDLKLELEKEAGVRKWTVTQYEALHSISIGKQMLLWEYIHRLQHQNRLLMNNQGHGYVESNSSPSLSLSELASYVEGQGSQGFDGDIERKGTARRNSLESNSKLDPNAVSFRPSSSPAWQHTERHY